MKLKQVTKETKELYKNLNEKNINCILEYSDGDKHVDICIPKFKIYIEVDDLQHCISPKQIITDFKRDSYFEQDGFDTIHIPNLVLEEHVEEIANAIVEVVESKIKYARK